MRRFHVENQLEFCALDNGNIAGAFPHEDAFDQCATCQEHVAHRPEARQKLGDVHLTWENEARLEVQEAGGELEIVNPPTSILATPPVAVVDANAKRHGTEAAAKAYLEYLYTDDGQEIIAKNFYRPVKPEVLARHKADFPDVKLFPVTTVAKDWNDAFAKFFGEGKVFDSIYKP